eukprot:5301077-Amphidinium_carterae.1
MSFRVLDVEACMVVTWQISKAIAVNAVITSTTGDAMTASMWSHEVSRDGALLARASAELKRNRHIVLAAVSQDGEALQHAAPELKSDKEIVLAAVLQNGYHPTANCAAQNEQSSQIPNF